MTTVVKFNAVGGSAIAPLKIRQNPARESAGQTQTTGRFSLFAI